MPVVLVKDDAATPAISEHFPTNAGPRGVGASDRPQATVAAVVVVRNSILEAGSGLVEQATKGAIGLSKQTQGRTASRPPAARLGRAIAAGGEDHMRQAPFPKTARGKESRRAGSGL